MNKHVLHIKNAARCALSILVLLVLSLTAGNRFSRWHFLLVHGYAANSSAPQPQKAQAAFDFVDSIGVNTHLNYFDRTYGNFGLVKNELQSIGIRHLRDGVHLQNADYNNFLFRRWIELGSLGIRFDAVLDPRSKLGPLTSDLLEQVNLLAGHSIDSFEGPNELDISGMADWVSVDRDFQRTLFSAVHALPAASRFRVLAPSLAFAANGKEFHGTLDAFDEENLHPYPAGKMPSVVFPQQTDLARQCFGDKPVVITETGYHNALNDHSDQPAVSEQAAAKYIPRLFLEDFRSGVSRTYLYEFLDEAPDPGLANHQLHWGLIRADGTEKPAFLAIKRLIAELDDHREPASAAQLSWSIATDDPAIDHLLLFKSNGEFDLVLWQEVPSYDRASQRDIANPAVETVLSLGYPARSAAIYEPSRQEAPIRTYANTATIPLSIPDDPLVVAVTIK
jgi:hypothetical protein